MIPASIPRLIDRPSLLADPLRFLQTARAVGELVIVLDGLPLFSLAPKCAGTVAAFGPAAVQHVLTNPDTFRMPVSVADRFSLPPRLSRLNAGLFSMHGERHRVHQQLLMSLLRRPRVMEYGAAIVQGWNAFKEGIFLDQNTGLLSEMRRLMLNVSGRIIFGSDGLELGEAIQRYFEDRRSFSAVESTDHQDFGSGREARRRLVRSGLCLDQGLRERLDRLHRDPGDGRGCMFAQLTQLESGSGTPLTDDDLVAHANILFMSGTEPMAVALTWTLLLLSQFPDICQAARQEVVDVFRGAPPEHFAEEELPLTRGVVLESLRLLPPNAIMVRLTSADADILGHRVPQDCEVLLSPYVDHRDASTFEDPDRFCPRRWPGLKPSPYAYMPFGAGSRYCLGKHLASFILVSILARILCEYDVEVAMDQAVDWKMHINLMPVNDPVVRFIPASGRGNPNPGRLGGPLCDLIQGRPSGGSLIETGTKVRANSVEATA